MASNFCNKCEITKPTYEFNHRSNTADGFQYMCKACNIEQKQQWRENNREHFNEHNLNYYGTNPQLRIYQNMHKKLWSILRRGCYSNITEQIIGLNQPTYLEWLSYNFEGEMWWANYGKVWQIDLIIPASAYDLTTEDG